MFIKLFTQILDSSIADNRQLRHLFTDLLLCADPKGMIMMTPSAIARRIGATVEEVQWGLEELQKPDPMSKTPDLDGSRIEALEGLGCGWRIVNYEAYRAMRDADQMREATKARVKRYREKKMGNVTHVTLGTPDVTHGNASQKKSQSQKEKKNQYNTIAGEPAPLISSKPKPETDPRHKPFIDSWAKGYQFHFGQKYAFNPVDAKQLKAFLGCNPELTESEWLAAAKVGWTLDPQFDKFLADQSKTLKGFVAQFAVLMSKCEVSPAPTQGQKDDDDDDYYARFLRNDAKLEAEIREAEGQPPTPEEIAELEDVL
jgi:hypothetical protein